MAGTVGFVWLGAMGGPMAQNLLKHGFTLAVHDVDPAGLNKEDGSAVIKVLEQLAGVRVGGEA